MKPAKTWRRSSPCSSRLGSGYAARKPGHTMQRSRPCTGRRRDTTITVRATSCWSVGDQIIETPCVIRGRSQETFSYRDMLMEFMASGARWYSAPRPMLRDELFDVDLGRPSPRNDEPAFDAANVLRFGRDLLYLVSATGNDIGGRWLQTQLGDEYRRALPQGRLFRQPHRLDPGGAAAGAGARQSGTPQRRHPAGVSQAVGGDLQPADGEPGVATRPNTCATPSAASGST